MAYDFDKKYTSNFLLTGVMTIFKYAWPQCNQPSGYVKCSDLVQHLHIVHLFLKYRVCLQNKSNKWQP